jgi:hypothetical protein
MSSRFESSGILRFTRRLASFEGACTALQENCPISKNMNYPAKFGVLPFL